MLIAQLITFTYFCITISCWALPGPGPNPASIGNGAEEISSGGTTQNLQRPRDTDSTPAVETREIEGDGDDEENPDDDCPSEPSPSSDFNTVTPTSSSTPFASVIGKDPGPCPSLPELAKRAGGCGTILLTSNEREWKIEYAEWPKPDVLYLKGWRDGKWYRMPYDHKSYISKVRFKHGGERFAIKFVRPYLQGGDMWFVYARQADGEGEGRLVKDWVKSGPRQDDWTMIRPKDIDPNAGAQFKWGRWSTNGLTDPEGIPVLWEEKGHDGERWGRDRNEVALTRNWIRRIQDRIPITDRASLFYTGKGVNGEQMNDFIRGYLHGNGFTYFDAFTRRGSYEGLIPDKPDWMTWKSYQKMKFMGIYRGSKAVAIMNRSSDIYVIMEWYLPNGSKRNIFDKPAKLVIDEWTDQELMTIGVGQVWYWVELPTLLRNPYVKRIWAVQPTPDGRWMFDKQWDYMDPRARPPTTTWATELDTVTEIQPLDGTVFR
ncbi:MAG: hypothetical protein Q9227_006223 [Pyrenula ochraceoflavens]